MPVTSICLFLADEAATEAVGRCLAPRLKGGDVLFLQGDLGAGKTTLSRGLIQARGHQGACKSPTYTLVEPYQLESGSVYHFDLYRLRDPHELDYLGLEDYFSPDALVLVEWPEKAGGQLPAPTLTMVLRREGDGRFLQVDAGNCLRGRELLDFLSKSKL